MDVNRAAELLAGTSLFSDLDPEALQRLAEVSVTRQLDRGQALFRQGDPGESLYVVVEGLLKVAVASGDGQEMLIATLRPPEVFGELSLLDEGPRSASAVATEPTTVLALGRADLLDVLHRYPAPVNELLKSMGTVIRRLTEQASDLVFLDLSGRTAKLLLQLAEREGSPAEDGTVLELSLSQGDLAEMVGVSRQSLNQTLHRFADRGWLRLDGGTIVLLDVQALEHRAGR